jgi:hypothetical protein
LRYRDFRDPSVLDFNAAYAEVFRESQEAAANKDYSKPADRRAILGRMRESKQLAWADWLAYEEEAAEAGWVYDPATAQWLEPVDERDWESEWEGAIVDDDDLPWDEPSRNPPDWVWGGSAVYFDPLAEPWGRQWRLYPVGHADVRPWGIQLWDDEAERWVWADHRVWDELPPAKRALRSLTRITPESWDRGEARRRNPPADHTWPIVIGAALLATAVVVGGQPGAWRWGG